MTKRLIEMGQVAAPHGIRGLVKINPFCSPERFAGYAPFYDQNGNKLDIKVKNLMQKQVLAQINNITDRTTAETLRGLTLFIDRAALQETEDGEYYVCDLKGMMVQDENGTHLGTVTDVENYGASDILDIKPAQGPRFMLAFSTETVKSIDLEKKLITVCLPKEVEGEQR